MGREAATKALLDAGITYDKVQQVWLLHRETGFHIGADL